jgi:hypothetical protein
MLAYFETQRERGRDAFILTATGHQEYMPQQHLACIRSPTEALFGNQDRQWVENIETMMKKMEEKDNILSMIKSNRKYDNNRCTSENEIYRR